MASKDQRKAEESKINDKTKILETSSDDSESEDEEGNSEKSSQEQKGVRTEVKTVASKESRKEEHSKVNDETKTTSDDSESEDEKGNSEKSSQEQKEVKTEVKTVASKDQRKEEQPKVKEITKRLETSSDDSESEEEVKSGKSPQGQRGPKTPVKTVASKESGKEERSKGSKILKSSSDDSDSDDEKGNVGSESTDSEDSSDSGGKNIPNERRQLPGKSTGHVDGVQASKGDKVNQATSNIKSDAAQAEKRKAASKKSRRSDSSSSSDEDSLKPPAKKVHSPRKVPSAAAKARLKTKPEDSAFSSGSDSDERAPTSLHDHPLSLTNKQVTPQAQKPKKKAAMVNNVTEVNDDGKVGNKPAAGERSDNEGSGFRETKGKGVDVPATPLLSSTMKLQPNSNNKEPESCNLSAIQTPRRKKKKSRKSVPGFS